MENLNKSIAFYCCTNGIGHFKRVSEISKYLTDSFNISIFCTKDQIERVGKIKKVKYEIYKVPNIDWALVLNNLTDQMFTTYFQWLSIYGPTTKNYDIVISDNLVGLLKYREDIILQGSFFWKDVLLSKIGTNKVTAQEEELLSIYTPKLLTNKYVETQSVKVYPNRIQFGFGFEKQRSIFDTINVNLINDSSLKYLPSYIKFIENLKIENNLTFINNFSYINKVRMFARPGVGTITHCVENNIPLIALYDNEDSQEIIELAQTVEDLGLGFKQDVNQPFNSVKFNRLDSNIHTNVREKIEMEGYKKIARYIKSL
jgi:hypothetical protein